MYNLRYHIASLVAVFLALAVGLVLGTVVAERGMLTDQGSALVDDLQRRFDEISTQNEELRTGLENDRAFAEDLGPYVIGGALAGQDVAIVVGTGRVDGLNAANACVNEAGGTSFVASLETPGLALADTAPEGLVSYFAARGIEMADPGSALEGQVAGALIAEWRNVGQRPLTDLLVSSGLLGLESMSETATVDGLVIMASADGGADSFALALGRAIREGGGVAVGAEAQFTESGVAGACADEGFSAVDHLATVQGRYSLAWLLARRAEGVFGTGDRAEAYYPPPSGDQ
jgi:hypothetical protein